MDGPGGGPVQRRAALAVAPYNVALSTVGYCHLVFRRPSAAWASTPPSHELEFVRALGFEGRAESQLARGAFRVGSWRTLSSARRETFLAEFARAADRPDTSVLDAGKVLVLVADSSPSVANHLAEIRVFLRELLRSGPGPSPRDGHRPLEDALAVAAHEIRGPLVAARAAVERALMEPQAPRARHLLERSVRDLESLSRDLSGLLELASGLDRAVLEPTSVRSLVRDACRFGAPGPASKRITVAGTKDATVLVNRRAMSSAVANLIRNALAYSPEGSPVDVRFGVDRDSASISVADAGPGIPALELDEVFWPFVQGRSSGAGSNGAGIGLFIAKKVVHAHGGELTVETYDGGAVFTIMLPKARAA
ncbi:MAG: sensor histidine kinase [Actinomycetota bacterium]